MLEVCPFFDKIQVIENTASRAAFYVRKGFNQGISGYGKEAMFSAQTSGSLLILQLNAGGSVFCIWHLMCIIFTYES